MCARKVIAVNLVVESSVASNNRASITLRRDDLTWEAQDPKQMLSHDSGTINASIANAMGLFHGGSEVVRLYIGSFDSLEKDAKGSGYVIGDTPESAVDWVVTQVVRE